VAGVRRGWAAGFHPLGVMTDVGLGPKLV